MHIFFRVHCKGIFLLDIINRYLLCNVIVRVLFYFYTHVISHLYAVTITFNVT